ncbi:MAG: ribosomal rRNA E-loop binding protein Ctc/L25/TL5 [Thermomicrobiales bacterium]|jgi:large subunit ribosomal protein L25|nr:ribosomal rRNA E-loop binding protein Ctc/L25/TL5 [Thermomicrobiales bacterium]MDF3038144.1 ribosomal rRNA E-loop binding protein Ctc/L25/TL5 [Thermomicrobiales bacterium]
MANQEFPAQRRTVLGKQVKRLRREGLIPGVVYGPVVEEPVPVSVDFREFVKFYQRTGHSTLFDLRWEDGSQSVFIREVQNDPVKRTPVHIDFFAPNLLRLVRAMVPLVLHNPPHLTAAVLTEARTVIEVEALPASIPHQIDVDVSGLEQPGDAIRVGDLTLPENVTAVTDPGELLVLIEAVYAEPLTAEEEEAAEVAAEAAEAAAEAEAGEAEPAAETSEE